MALRDVIERIRGLPESPNEEAAKLQVILPILQELGWDPRDPSKVAPEHSVGGGRADFALLGPSGKPVAVIEAKAPGSRLEDHVPQVVGYAFHTGVDICVLKTGFRWWLYLPRERGLPAERRFAELKIETDTLDSLVASFEAYLAHEALASNRAEENAKQALREQAFLREWDKLLREPPEKLIDLIEKHMSRSPATNLDRGKIADFLRRQGHGSPSPAFKEPAKICPPPPSVPKRPRSPAASIKPVAYVLFGQRHDVKSWKEVWVGVAERLYERHGDGGFERIVGTPDGRKSYVERGSPRTGTQRAVASSRYWIETHGSAEEMKRRSRKLLSLFGHGKDDLGIESD